MKTEDLIKRLLEEKRLENFRIERRQIEKHVQAAHQDLKEAEATFSVSDKAPYLFAYTAMLKMARAFLFLKGYRPKREGQHQTVVEVAGAFLGEDFKVLTEHFDWMRRKRNKLIYDVGGLVSHTESEEAFKTAREYLNQVQKLMEKEDPQLKFRFD